MFRLLRWACILGGLALWCAALFRHLQREWGNPLKSFAEWESFRAANGDRTEWEPLRPGGEATRVFWFTQVSDIHVNRFGHGSGTKHLEYFLRETLPIIKPLFVVATGDLTDAKQNFGLGSKQHQEEWETYRSLLQRAGVFDRPDFWFDIRGNHDCFDVPSWDSERNLFARYSKQGMSSFGHVFDLPFGKYGLVAIDGCPDYGPSRPFNFFGSLTTAKMDTLEQHLVSMQDRNVRHTFMIAHYPIVTMQFQQSSKGTTFAELSRHISAYMSGHLHRLFAGLGKQIYAIQPSGFLEIEVNDLKAHHMFRVVAVDHDVISFVDVPTDTRPIVLITNPVDARFLIPSHEDVRTASRSSHIRVLIFSDKATIGEASVSVDGGPPHKLARADDPSVPLYTAPWNPLELSAGLHTIAVTARDESGRTTTVSQQFSLDGTVAPIGSFGEWLAQLRLEVWVKRSFWLTLLSLLLGCLLLPAVFVQRKKSRSAWESWRVENIKSARDARSALDRCGWTRYMLNFPMWSLRTFWLRLCLLQENSVVFWTHLLYLLYLPVGPILAGPLGSSDSSMSFMFVWGIWRWDVGWIRLLDTWTYSNFVLSAQVATSYVILSIFATSQELYTTPLPSAGRNGAAASDTSKIRPHHRRLWFSALLLVWWMTCGLKSAILMRTYGLLILLCGVGSVWHFALFTLMLLHCTWGLRRGWTDNKSK